MAKKAKTVTSADMVTQEMLFAEEEWAPMRPALAVAPELVMQATKRKPKQAKKKAKKAKAAKTKARKASPKKARKAAPKKKKTRKTKKAARKK
jgi:hypothetical protein